MTEKLKPCPFCGSLDIEFRSPSYATCSECGADGPIGNADNVIDKWNTRAEIDYIEYIGQREEKCAKVCADEKKKKKARGQ